MEEVSRIMSEFLSDSQCDQERVAACNARMVTLLRTRDLGHGLSAAGISASFASLSSHVSTQQLQPSSTDILKRLRQPTRVDPKVRKGLMDLLGLAPRYNNKKKQKKNTQDTKSKAKRREIQHDHVPKVARSADDEKTNAQSESETDADENIADKVAR